MQKPTTILLSWTLLILAACAGSERDFSETSIADLHDQMQRGDVTSEELVDWYTPG
jgi:hypothetical protein